jgi:cytochrome c5
MVRAAFVVGLALALSACSEQRAPETPQQIVARTANAAPADPRLADLYASSCRSCHGQADTGAPLTLNRAAWDPLWAKGEQTLLEHAIGGFNGMPAGGQCFSCSADDHRALIRFMAGREG